MSAHCARHSIATGSTRAAGAGAICSYLLHKQLRVALRVYTLAPLAWQ